GYEREHGPAIHPGGEERFDHAAWREGPPGHEAAHGDTAGEEINERHHGADAFDAKLGEGGFESRAIATKDDPGHRAIGAGERPGGGKFPVGRIRLKWFV